MYVKNSLNGLDDYEVDSMIVTDAEYERNKNLFYQYQKKSYYMGFFSLKT